MPFSINEVRDHYSFLRQSAVGGEPTPIVAGGDGWVQVLIWITHIQALVAQIIASRRILRYETSVSSSHGLPGITEGSEQSEGESRPSVQEVGGVCQ